MTATDFTKAIGNRIAFLRRGHNMSQRGLAQKAGLSFTAIQRYEAGTLTISVHRLGVVCEALYTNIPMFLSVFPGPHGDGFGNTKEQPYLDTDQCRELTALVSQMPWHKQNALLVMARVLAERDNGE